MAIKYNGQDLQKRIINGQQVQKVMYNGTQIWPTGPVPVPEYIEYKMTADSNGDLCVPLGGYSTSGYQNCVYDWQVSVDGGTATRYTGTGGSGWEILLSGYTPDQDYNVKIEPTTEAYLWARAYGWDGNSTHRRLLKEVVYDGSYMGYGLSATDTGGYFRKKQYYACLNLTSAPNDYLANTVTTIGTEFRNEQYYYCSSLTLAASESMPNSVTSIGINFRNNQYAGCSSLLSAPTEVISNSVTYIPNYFRSGQYQLCTSLTTTADEVLPPAVNSFGERYRGYQYYGCTGLTSATLTANGLSGTEKRYHQFDGAGNTATPMTISIPGDVLDVAYYSAGLDDYKVNEIRVPNSQLSNYQNSYDWSAVSSKFVGVNFV